MSIRNKACLYTVSHITTIESHTCANSKVVAKLKLCVIIRRQGYSRSLLLIQNVIFLCYLVFISWRPLRVHISKAKGTTRPWNKTNVHALRCLLSVAPNLEPQIQTLCIQRNENCFNLHLLITTKCQFDVFSLFFKTIQMSSFSNFAKAIKDLCV